MAWRRAQDRKMAVLAAAFAVAGAGGALFLLGEIAGGALQNSAPLLLASSMLGALVLLYAALFARRN